MNRPNLPKPSVDEWKSSEQLLKKFVTHINNKLFDIAAWHFWIPSQNRKVTYNEILKNIEPIYPHLKWIEAIKSWFKYFPADLLRMKKDVNVIFLNHTARIEEQLNFITKQEEYITHLEAELEGLKKKTETSQKAEQDRLTEETKKLHQERVSELSELKDEVMEALKTLAANSISFEQVIIDVPEPEPAKCENAFTDTPKSKAVNTQQKRSFQ